MNITTIVSRVIRAAKRGMLIALAALVLTSVVVPPAAIADRLAAYQRPADGIGDNPQMP